MARLSILPSRIATLDPRTTKPPAKTADPFYLTTEWRALVEQLIRERGRRCEYPGCGRTNCRIFGDHVVERQDGGAELDPANVQLLCGSCHTRKTQQARAERMARRY